METTSPNTSTDKVDCDSLPPVDGPTLVFGPVIETIERSTLCLFQEQQPGILARSGSAVLFQIADVRFMLTAAHTWDGLKTNAHHSPVLMAVSETGPLVPLTTSEGIEVSPADGGAVFDMAAVVLDASTVAALGHRVSYLLCSQVDWCDVHPGDRHYIALGYPTENFAVRASGSYVRSPGVGFHGTPYAGDDVPLQGYDPTTHFALSFDLNSSVHMEHSTQSEWVQSPRPVHLNGISGCGMWHIHHNLPDVGQRPRLVAIEHTWSQTRGAVIGTRIAVILQMIRLRYPELRNAMDISFATLPMVELP